VEPVETDGRLAAISGWVRQGRIEALVIPLEGLTPNEFSSLRSLKAATGVCLIGIAPGNTLPASIVEMLDRVASRSSGAEGLRQALNTSRQRSLAVREPAAAYVVRPRLTTREAQVAHLVSRGLSNRRIAESLGIREQSVKNLVSVLMRKLQCENRVQVALHLTSQGAFTVRA
jgi:DNA-binding NarL/FixJ family response regulator